MKKLKDFLDLEASVADNAKDDIKSLSDILKGMYHKDCYIEELNPYLVAKRAEEIAKKASIAAERMQSLFTTLVVQSKQFQEECENNMIFPDEE